MKKISLLVVTILLISSVFGQNATNKKMDKRVKFEITTPYGVMKGELYNETPGHRDNFIKLVNEGWYENSPFHRVIKDFMIQGGQNADGRLDPGYTIPAEIKPELLHKKGALAAARTNNPAKASSGSQLYIVHNANGTPHLDGQYTVYGQITEGLDVIDKIASVKTGYQYVPVEKVTMKIKIVK